MIPGPDVEQVRRFRDIVTRALGLKLEDEKLEALGTLLERRRAASPASSFTSYLARLAVGSDGDELRAIARALTVGETYFFRNADQFRAFTDVVLPDRLRASTRRKLRILSAGCASGEEAYSVAMLLTDRQHELAGCEVEIQGIDVNDVMIGKARQARYSSWALRETSPEVMGRFFRDGVLDAAIRRAVSFEARNLVDDDPAFWAASTFDVVFCRNVTMYFTTEVMRAVIARIARSLTPGGFLFLGHAETLRGISTEFHLRHTHDTFYYQRREPEDGSADHRIVTSARAMPGIERDDWFDIIQRSSERVATLAQREPIPSDVPGAPSRDPGLLAPVVDLIRTERYAEALEHMRSMPDAAKSDPAAQLLLAIILTNRGDRVEAKRACDRLLELDELNAGAHHLLALLCEQAGDGAGAIEHERTSAYLDKTFSSPRLHLGLAARRVGDLETARRELGRALVLLADESTARLALFGGGFSREALAALCRSELRACGVLA